MIKDRKKKRKESPALKVEMTSTDCRPSDSLAGGVQPAVHGLHAAQDGCEHGPTQNLKFT